MSNMIYFNELKHTHKKLVLSQDEFQQAINGQKYERNS